MTGEPEPHRDEEADEDLKWPIGFIVMVALAGLYLLVRFIQLGARLFDWLF